MLTRRRPRVSNFRFPGRATRRAPMNEPPEKLAEGTLISHLLELRDRLLRALVVVAIAFLPCVYYANDLFSFVARPLLAKLPEGSNLIAIGVMSPFTTPFKLSFIAALMLAMPYVIYQLWAFVAPGLYRNERRFAVPLLVFFHPAVLHRHRVRLLLCVSGDVRVLRPHDAQGRGHDDGYQQLPGLRAHHVHLLRAGVRGAGRGGAAGGDGRRAHREAEEEPRLCADRHFHPRSTSHAAGCYLAVLACHPDVPALRRRHPHGGPADTQLPPRGAGQDRG